MFSIPRIPRRRSAEVRCDVIISPGVSPESVRGGIFENHPLKALYISFKKVVLPGRVKCGGTEEKIVVAHGRLPSPLYRDKTIGIMSI